MPGIRVGEWGGPNDSDGRVTYERNMRNIWVFQRCVYIAKKKKKARLKR